MVQHDSTPALIEVRRFVSSPATILVGNYQSAPATIDVNRFVSSWANFSGHFGIPGGYLSWVTSTGTSCILHAARVHDSISGALPHGKHWWDTPISEANPVRIIGSSHIISPFYASPSIHLDDSGDPRIVAVSDLLAAYSFGEGKFVSRMEGLPTQSTTVAVAAALDSGRETRNAVVYLSSGNIYFQGDEDEEEFSSSSMGSSESSLT